MVPADNLGFALRARISLLRLSNNAKIRNVPQRYHQTNSHWHHGGLLLRLLASETRRLCFLKVQTWRVSGEQDVFDSQDVWDWFCTSSLQL